MPALEEDEIRFALPELLVQVFRSLDTTERQRCRRTCHLWDAILCTLQLCQEARVSLEDKAGLMRCNYAAYCCLFKHITRATRTICIYDRYADGDQKSLQYEDVANAGQMVGHIKKILDDNGGRIEQLILYRRATAITAKSVYFWQYLNDISALYAGLATCCERVVWKGYALNFGAIEGRNPVLEFRIPYADFRLNAIVEADFWVVFEKHLCSRKPLNVDQISQWTMDLIARKSKSACNQLIRILCEYQIKDPRVSNRGWIPAWTSPEVKTLTVAHLGSLDVRKLNNICLSVLEDYMEKGSD
ncbi:uncharacterized protein LOC129601789 [Paramacrobiotus metropolitanus]|uniref:uncharacterized protein LOC129601789 n=1 Tax=Paramacrobiotus metropolitanus TaxID=2943436 RepID=UPI002445E16F|nr:uncharacterized protein LOC129601789 [Paramacrobiotus metropolitanus]